ncbi:hypothetical protein YM304_29820 [Ilumatobacter coccineus YM16-304]|uniref:SGNH hydrolase-type esterase domain-containing protein n=1 Tax=Ilumatobacter coccineus (strain NBRC 103263 / KCTC 29153 / YM16-304) TaxID=1313172 RepID=A0A6C7EH49_ILUCY|nr:hypothetical protein YM304_29820 [Ilumatobacter coccineus YM16-304]
MVGVVIRRLLLTGAVVLAATVAVGAGDSDVPVVEAAPESERVTLFSDSVGLGTRGYFDRAFPASYEANVFGTPALFVEQLESKHVRPTLAGARHLIGDHVVIAAGYNYPYWDPARFDRSIDSMIDTLTNAGVKHVYWVTLREVKPEYISASAWRQVQPYYWYFPTVNDHLESALGRHPNLTLVDWAAVADRPGITYDAIHLNGTGAELYSATVADAVRTNATRPVDGSVTKIDVTDTPGVSAVALNLASTNTRTTGYFTAFACGDTPPDVANLNYERGDISSAAAIVPVDDDGNVCVYVDAASNVIVDVFGTFDESTGLTAVAPNRVADSRSGSPQSAGDTLELKVASAGATAVALNVTGIRPTSFGYITVHGCDDEPTTATVNLAAGVISSNLVMVRPDDDGNVCVTTSDTTSHLTVDRFATFTNEASIIPVTPTRLLDSRPNGEPSAGQVHRFDVADTPIVTDETASLDADDVSAVFMNLAVVAPQANGFSTAWPCSDPRPDTANVNFRAGVTVSNFVTVAPDESGEVCVWTSAAAHVVIDVLGAAASGFDGFTPVRKIDTRN